jgi:hypothetical protein
LVTQDIEGYPSVRVNVRMIDSSGEADAWSTAWVIRGEPNRHEEEAARIWGIGLDADVSVKFARESSGKVSQAQ